MIKFQRFSKYYEAICILIVLLLFFKNVFAEKGDDLSPDVRPSWQPNVQEGYIDLKLTNSGKNLVAVSPYLHVLYDIRGDKDLGALLPDGESKIINVAVLIIGPHSGKISPTFRRGPPPEPVEIAAGETKTIKLLADSNLIAITKAKDPATAKLCLFFDHKAVSITPITISDGIWKQK